MSKANSSTLRAVCYYRKSNDDEGGSIAQQRDWARTRAQQEGLLIVQEFADQSRAGWNTGKREAFADMLDFCRAEAADGRTIDAVVCWAPDRFSRADSQETSWFLWEFRKVGTDRMLTQTEGWLDFARAETRTLFGIKQEMGAHSYVKELAQGTMRGRMRSAKEGRWLQAAPFGFVKVPRPGGGSRLALGDDATVETVRWMFARFIEPDGSLNGIARELTARGVKPPRSSQGWGHPTIRKILKNPAYLGRVVWNRTRHGRFAAIVGLQVKLREKEGGKVERNGAGDWIEAEEAHDAIIDPETFERVQVKLAGLKQGQRAPSYEYPLAGLLYCGHCGRRMDGGTIKRPRPLGGEYVYRSYHCRGSDAVVNRCHWNGIDCDELLAALVRRLQQTVFREETLRKAIGEIRKQDAEAASAKPDREAKLTHRLKGLADKLAAAERRFAEEEDESLWPALRGRIQELRAQHAEAAGELAALERKGSQERVDLEALAEAAIDAGLQLHEAVQAGDTDLVRQMIDLAVERVDLYFAEAEGNDQRKRKRYSFAKGIIHVRPDFPFSGTRYTLFRESQVGENGIALNAVDLLAG